jgi:hypothetical protein
LVEKSEGKEQLDLPARVQREKSNVKMDVRQTGSEGK